MKSHVSLLLLSLLWFHRKGGIGIENVGMMGIEKAEGMYVGKDEGGYNISERDKKRNGRGLNEG